MHPKIHLREAVKDIPTHMHPTIALAIKPLPANKHQRRAMTSVTDNRFRGVCSRKAFTLRPFAFLRLIHLSMNSRISHLPLRLNALPCPHFSLPSLSI